MNACRLSGRHIGSLRVVVSGAGAAGVAVTRMLLEARIGKIAVADRDGLIYEGRPGLGSTPVKARLAQETNSALRTGSVSDALVGADVFIGLSSGRVSNEAVTSMAPGCFVFAMANPDPEMDPSVAHPNVAVLATGRSDYPNQINNVLAFPGVFSGALRVRATDITQGTKHAAAQAIAALVEDDLSPEKVIPSVFDPRVARRLLPQRSQRRHGWKASRVASRGSRRAFTVVASADMFRSMVMCQHGWSNEEA
jgi:malate dehydrogenase (oxaloacetate-decarboxylating)